MLADAQPRCDETAPELAASVLVSGLPGTPDGIARAPDGALFAALSTGDIARIEGSTFRIAGTAPTARLTGLTVAADGIVYAVDEVGGAVYRFAPTASSAAKGEAILREVDGRTLKWTNDITATSDGALYVTTSSQRRTLDQFYDEILEHRGSGQLIRFDPHRNVAQVLRSDLNMANGVAAHETGGVLVAESSTYSVRRFTSVDGSQEAIAKNLPGFPGNIRAADRPGVYWLTLLSPRNALIDQLAGAPWARRLMAWLPASVRPGPKPIHCLVRITLADAAPRLEAFRIAGPPAMPSLSTALEVAGKLYLTPSGLAGVARGEIYVVNLADNAP